MIFPTVEDDVSSEKKQIAPEFRDAESCRILNFQVTSFEGWMFRRQALFIFEMAPF